MLRNWPKVIPHQEEVVRLLVVIHHEDIKELASLRFFKPKLENQNI